MIDSITNNNLYTSHYYGNNKTQKHGSDNTMNTLKAVKLQ